MKLLSRHVTVSKSYEITYRIIKSCACNSSKGYFLEKSFSMYCAKRFKGGIISQIPIKGTIIQNNDFVEVTLSTHCDFGIYLGCFLCLLGIIGLFLCIILNSARWIPCVGSVMLGMLIGGQSIWEGNDYLEMLERKLLN